MCERNNEKVNAQAFLKWYESNFRKFLGFENDIKVNSCVGKVLNP